MNETSVKLKLMSRHRVFISQCQSGLSFRFLETSENLLSLHFAKYKEKDVKRQKSTNVPDVSAPTTGPVQYAS